MKHIDVPVCVCAYAFSSSLSSTSASSVVFSITKDSVYVLSTALAYYSIWTSTKSCVAFYL